MRRRYKKPRSYGALKMRATTEAGLVSLVVRHGLVDVPIPTLDPDMPPGKQTSARWLDRLAEDRALRMMVDKAGDRWLVSRTAEGLIEYARVEGVLRYMEREKRSGKLVGGETSDMKRKRLSAWLREELREAPGTTP